jgi:hypothetical protein
MSLNYAPQTVTAEDYERIFALERRHEYPTVDALEQRLGYAIDRARLEGAARVLACPMKAGAPSWQHGRVIYAVARARLGNGPSGCWTFLDIGSAKGFSALCLQWALMDHAGGSLTAGVTSVDVLPPGARVRRNTVAEVDGLRTLEEILAPWPEASMIRFEQSTGVAWLRRNWKQIEIAFVDGKHTGDVVYEEGQLLAERQESGDIVIFDDCQVPGVSAAVRKLTAYEVEYLEVLPTRKYGIGVRK